MAQFKLGGFNSVICAQVNINIFVLARLAVAEPDVYDTGDKSEHQHPVYTVNLLHGDSKTICTHIILYNTHEDQTVADRDTDIRHHTGYQSAGH